jgi:hypothetical protein
MLMLNARIRDQLAEQPSRTDATAVQTLACGATAPDDGALASPQLFTVTAMDALDEPELLTHDQNPWGPPRRQNGALVLE